MISDTSKFHGAAIATIIDEIESGIKIRKIFANSVGFYILNDQLPILVKYTTKRNSPWSFTFNNGHLSLYYELCSKYGECIVILVCGSDGFVSIGKTEVDQIIRLDNENQKQISVIRKLKHMYAVSGTDGNINQRISRKNFFTIAQKYLKESD
jgi:hypothetical protein